MNKTFHLQILWVGWFRETSNLVEVALAELSTELLLAKLKCPLDDF